MTMFPAISSLRTVSMDSWSRAPQPPTTPARPQSIARLRPSTTSPSGKHVSFQGEAQTPSPHAHRMLRASSSIQFSTPTAPSEPRSSSVASNRSHSPPFRPPGIAKAIPAWITPQRLGSPPRTQSPARASTSRTPSPRSKTLTPSEVGRLRRAVATRMRGSMLLSKHDQEQAQLLADQLHQTDVVTQADLIPFLTKDKQALGNDNLIADMLLEFREMETEAQRIARKDEEAFLFQQRLMEKAKQRPTHIISNAITTYDTIRHAVTPAAVEDSIYVPNREPPTTQEMRDLVDDTITLHRRTRDLQDYALLSQDLGVLRVKAEKMLSDQRLSDLTDAEYERVCEERDKLIASLQATVATLDDLRKHCAAIELTNSQYQTREDEHKKWRQEMEENHAQLIVDHQASTIQLAETSRSLSELQKEHTRLESMFNDSCIASIQSKAEAASLTHSLRSSNLSLQYHVAFLQNEVLDWREQYATLAKEHAAISHQLVNVNAELSSCRTEGAALRESLRDSLISLEASQHVEVQLRQTMATAEHLFSEETAKQQEVIAAHLMNISDCQKLISDLQQSLSDSATRVSVLESTIRTTNAELSLKSTRGDVLNVKLTKTSEDLTVLQEKYSVLDAKHTIMTAVLDNTQHHLSDSLSKGSLLRQRLDVTTSVLRYISESHENLSSNYAKLTSSHELLSADHIRTSTELASAQQSLVESLATYNASQILLSETQAVLETEQAAHDVSRAEAAKCQASLIIEISDRDESITKLKGRLENAAADRAGADVKAKQIQAELEAEILDLSGKITLLNTQAAAVQDETVRAKKTAADELQQTQLRVSLLEGLLLASQQRADSLDSTLTAVREELIQSQNNHKSEATSLKATLATLTKTSTDEIQRLKGELDRQTRKLESGATDRSELLASHEAQVDGLQADITSLKKKLSDTQKNLDRVTAELAVSQRLCDTHVERIQKLELDFDRVSKHDAMLEQSLSQNLLQLDEVRAKHISVELLLQKQTLSAEELTEKLEVVSKDLVTANSQLETADESLRALRLELTSLRESSKTVSDKTGSQISKLERDLAEVSEQLRTETLLRVDKEKALDDTVKELKTTKSDLITTTAQYKDALTNLEKTTVQLQKVTVSLSASDKKISELQSELASLVEAHKSEVSKLSAEIASLKDGTAKSRQQMDLQYSEQVLVNEHLRIRCAELDTLVKARDEELASLSKKQRDTVSLLESAKQAEQQLADKLAQSVKESEEAAIAAKAEISELISSRDSLKGSLEEVQTAKSELEIRISHVQESHSGEAKELDTKLQELQSQLQQTTMLLEQERTKSQATSSDLLLKSSEMARLSAELLMEQSELEKTHTTLNETSEKLSTALSELASEEGARQKAVEESEQLQSEIVALTAKLESSGDDVHRLTEELQLQRAMTTELQEGMNRATSELEKVNTDLDGVRTQLSEVKSGSESQISSTLEDLIATKAELEGVQQDRSDLQKEISQLKQELEEKSKSLSGESQALEEEKKLTQQRLESLKTSLELAEQDTDGLRAQVNDLKSRLREAEETKEKMSDDITEAVEQAKELRQELKTAQKQLFDTTDKLEQANKRVDELESAVSQSASSQQSTAAALQSDLASTKEELKQTTAALETLKKANAELLKAATELQAKSEEDQKVFDEYDAQAAELEAEAEKWQKAAEAAKKDVEKLRAYATTVKQQAEELQAAYAELEKENDATNAELDGFQKTMETWQKEQLSTWEKQSVHAAEKAAEELAKVIEERNNLLQQVTALRKGGH